MSIPLSGNQAPPPRLSEGECLEKGQEQLQAMFPVGVSMCWPEAVIRNPVGPLKPPLSPALCQSGPGSSDRDLLWQRGHQHIHRTSLGYPADIHSSIVKIGSGKKGNRKGHKCSRKKAELMWNTKLLENYLADVQQAKY